MVRVSGSTYRWLEYTKDYNLRDGYWVNLACDWLGRETQYMNKEHSLPTHSVLINYQSVLYSQVFCFTLPVKIAICLANHTQCKQQQYYLPTIISTCSLHNSLEPWGTRPAHLVQQQPKVCSSNLPSFRYRPSNKHTDQFDYKTSIIVRVTNDLSLPY